MPLILGQSCEDDEVMSNLFIKLLGSGITPPPFTIGTVEQFGRYKEEGDWEHTLGMENGELFGKWLAQDVLQIVEEDIASTDYQGSKRYLSTIRLWAEQAINKPKSVPDQFWQGVMTPHLHTDSLCYRGKDYTLNTERVRMMAAMAPSSEVLAVYKEYALDGWFSSHHKRPQHASPSGIGAVKAEVMVRASTDLTCRAAMTSFEVGESVERDMVISSLAVQMLMVGLTPPVPLMFDTSYGERDKKGQHEVEEWTVAVIMEVEAALTLESCKILGDSYLNALQRWSEKGASYEPKSYAFWNGLTRHPSAVSESLFGRVLANKRIRMIEEIIPFGWIESYLHIFKRKL